MISSPAAKTRVLTLAVALISGVVFAADKAADAAFDGAKDAYQQLKKDESRRKFRHHWLNVAKKFDLVAVKFAKSDRAPEALFSAGELYNELSRFSGNDEDVDSAEKAYRKLIDGWPKHRLADDAALSLARLLADRQGDPAAARKVLAAALDTANDRKKDIKTLLASLEEDAKKPGKKPAADDKAEAGEPKKEAGRKDAAKADPKRGADADGKKGEPGKKSDAAKRADAAEPRKNDAGKKGADATGEEEEEPGAKGSAPKRAEADTKHADPKHGATERGGPKGANGGSGSQSEPARAEAAKADAKHDAAVSSGALADAIRRTGRAVESARGLSNLTPPEEPKPTKLAEEAQGRRLPPTRPAAAVHESDDVDEEASQSALEGLQERLRDVRVGAKKPDESARARFKTLAKAEGSAELTLAQQLGLKVRRVVVDAGHGGHDTGAIGPRGTREKDVALSIAQKLATRLEELGLEVVQTRDDDSFVKLEDRTRIANKEKGDLFISIHCNAAPTKALRGIETYTLNTSSNRYAIRLAARENATTERGVGDLQYILADLATKANTGESTRLAQRVQKGLIENLSTKFKDVRDLGNKEALFFVLLGAKMPSILVETSFVSNPDEEARLVSDDYQNQIADSIAGAVSGFLEEREKQLAQLDER